MADDPLPLDLSWRGAPVGRLVRYRPDMWYLEGTFEPLAGAHADAFRACASALDVRAVMAAPTRGTRVELSEGGRRASSALVLSLDGPTLFVRQVFDPAAVAWLHEHVT